ncbi:MULTISPECIES: GlsB/YeaQ/YmgE family stress response membrane protein [Micrococcaceae]|uniref:GlsB/YeaQ/YmgE family stress response membrane protein n=1 Tax=unclassified Kocuria TaxID=2649579 RepID=UPI001012F016|nr:MULTISPECIES: GlsB/YeaQ/YmgE family stress response membrane protein [unclassified Kocuria]
MGLGFIGWIVIGIIVGALAKLIMPGRQGGGIIVTMILGIVGGLLGGWIGGAIFGVHGNGFFSLTTWLLALVGSLIVLFIWGLIFGRKNRA